MIRGPISNKPDSETLGVRRFVAAFWRGMDCRVVERSKAAINRRAPRGHRLLGTVPIFVAGRHKNGTVPLRRPFAGFLC